MSDESEEREISVDWDDSKSVRNYVYQKRGGPISEEQQHFETWYRETILFPQQLHNAGYPTVEPVGGDQRGSDKRSSGSLGGLLGGLLGGFEGIDWAEEIAKGTIEKGLLMAAPPAALITAWWLAESHVERMPPILHTIVNVLIRAGGLLETLLNGLISLINADLFEKAKEAVTKAFDITGKVAEYTSNFIINELWRFIPSQTVMSQVLDLFGITDPNAREVAMNTELARGIAHQNPLAYIQVAAKLAEPLARILGLEAAKNPDKSPEEIINNPVIQNALMAVAGPLVGPILVSGLTRAGW